MCPRSIRSTAWALSQGVIEIKPIGSINTTKLLDQRHTISKPTKYKLMIALGDSKRVVPTRFVKVSTNGDEAGKDFVSFESETLYFLEKSNNRKTKQDGHVTLRLF